MFRLTTPGNMRKVKEMNELFDELEEKYNTYNVPMSKEDVFTLALGNGDVVPEVYVMAKSIYGASWTAK